MANEYDFQSKKLGADPKVTVPMPLVCAPLPTMTIYSAADVNTIGAFVQFGDYGVIIRCTLIESIKIRHFSAEHTTDLTLRMTSGHKFRFTVRTADVLTIVERLNGT